MGSNLLEKLQQSAKTTKNIKKHNLNENSNFNTLTNEEIALVLALRAKKLRILDNKKQTDFSNEAELSSPTTYSNFEQKGTVSFLNFIKIMRNFDRLHELDLLLKPTISQEINKPNKDKKRVC